MLSLEDSPYLTKIHPKWGDYTLNSYLYGEFVCSKSVKADKFLSVLRELLCTLGFGFRFIGFQFLEMAAAFYYTGLYSGKAKAIADIAELYNTEPEFVSDNINAVLGLNTIFIGRSRKLLRKNNIAEADGQDLDSAVAIIGAIFKTYYNYNVTEGNLADGITKSTDYLKVLFDGSSDRK